MRTIITTVLIYAGIILFAGVGNAQSINNNAPERSFYFIEPAINISQINKAGGLILGITAGYEMRDKFSAGFTINRLFSENIYPPREHDPRVYANLFSLGGEFDYRITSIRIIDISAALSIGLIRATYTDTRNAFSFSTEFLNRIGAGITAGFDMTEMIQLKVGGTYGFLLTDNNINYSIPTIDQISGEGSIPINYQGFSVSLSVRFRLIPYQ